MRHLKSYSLFENNKNQPTIDEFFSVMQGTPEGSDFMKWFVANPKRTGRIYITTKNESGVFLPARTFFDRESDGSWSYRYVSAGNEYGHQYGDLKGLFRRIIIDSIIRSIPPGIKKSEIEEFFAKNPVTPGTLPDKVQTLIDLFIRSERGTLIDNMSFLRDLPWIKEVTSSQIYTITNEGRIFSISFSPLGAQQILGISPKLSELLTSLGIYIRITSSLDVVMFIPGSKGKKRQKIEGDRGMKYSFYLGYETQEEIKEIAEGEINKCLEELECRVKTRWVEDNTPPFLEENLKSLIKYGKFLPGYKEQFNSFMAELIGDEIQQDYSKLSLLKDHPQIIEILRGKRPDIFGKSEEETQKIMKGASVISRFGGFDQ